MTCCEVINELKTLLAQIQEQEFVSVEELKGKLENLQDLLNNYNCE